MLPELEAVTDNEMTTRCTDSSARGSFLHFGLLCRRLGLAPHRDGKAALSPVVQGSYRLSFIFRSNILFPSTLLFKHKKLVNETYPQIIFITLILYSLRKVVFFFSF